MGEGNALQNARPMVFAYKMQVMSTGGDTSEEAAGPVSDPQIERLIALWLK